MAVSASSPIREIGDPDHYLSRSEFSQRLLKRARRFSNPEPLSSKKQKQPEVTPAGSPSQQQYETPHPSVLSEEQKFKLNSSRGLPVHPDQFSPLPVSRRRISRTGSRNLKENTSLRATKKGKLLDSPFNSRPSSAASSPQKSQPVRSSPTSTEHPAQGQLKRTLSDTYYNPNIPQSASTTTSPTHAHSPIRTRRPSAPSPLRSIPKDTAFEFDFHSALVNPFFLPSAINDIDFDRPPSSFSFYGDADSQFFDEVQGSSTPPPKNSPYTLGSAIADDDDDEFQQADLTITQDPMDIDTTCSTGMEAFPTRERSPWLSDSLISPPNSQEWNRLPQEDPQSSSKDVNMTDSLSVGLAPASVEPTSDTAEEHVSHPDGLQPGDCDFGDRDLRQMFDGLGLATKSRFFNPRTSSLDSPPNDDENPKPKGRDRRGTIRASDFKTSIAPARRTRSGTVIGPPTQNQRVHSPNDPEGAGSVGEVDENEELNDWCADDWIVAAPPSPVLTRKRPTKKKAVDTDFETDPLDTLSKGSELLPSPVLHLPKKGSRKAVTTDVVMEEEDDELLLKPGFNVWE
ncbi:hypothetical protein MSAN_02204200 [Mycena sanguinolenta]|uniref:Uncharacterized protein n=1 Tax=Mycena sanguinolenta TaxID=230812 RepID=A0A8H7CIL3_9AGAR|nr:hypothetical protein MSAN_02204200 [Mycena sanguinolenta]